MNCRISYCTIVLLILIKFYLGKLVAIFFLILRIVILIVVFSANFLFVYAIQCADSDREDLYIGETKQTLAKRMYQHRRASTGCGDSAVFQHLDSTKHTFNNKDVIILDKEHRWYERGVKEAIYVTKEQPSLNKGGGLRHNLAGPTVL